MPFSLNRRYRHMRRYRKIGEVLLKHGFGYLVQQLDLAHFLPPLKRLQSFRQREHYLSMGTRLRLALEELGPTFIKLGQLLSTRPDVLPDELIAELERLQDNVAPISFAKIREQIQSELDQPIEVLFAELREEPVAGASIGQVHYGVLHDGTEVVVKVRRPGVERLINTDLEILVGLAKVLRDRIQRESVDVQEIVEEFSTTIRKELDYTKEGRNIERFQANFCNVKDVRIPKVFWEFSTARVLTMEYIRGQKVNNVVGLRARGYDLDKLADTAAKAFMKQVFTDGFFHGDPHPGNLLVCPDGSLAFLDFGVVGRVDSLTMQGLAHLLVAITRRDVGQMLEVLRDLQAFTAKPTRGLQRDLHELIDLHYGRALKELRFSLIVEDLLALVRRHPLRLPSELMLLAKALVTVEGVGSQLVPEFNVMEVAEPFARQWMKTHYSASALAQRGVGHLHDWGRFLGKLPNELESILDTVNQGELVIHFRHEGLEKLMHRLDVVSNRLTFGIIIAALIMGSSLLLLIDQGPRFMQVPIIGLFGFVLAGLIGIWLLLSIVRSGKY